ncbi:sensor histidine kinase [Hydrogenimonas sp.]
MGSRLGHWERKALTRFMVVYLGAGFVVVATFSWLFYAIDAEALRDRVLSQLRTKATEIAATAVRAQMEGAPFTLPETKDRDTLLLDDAGRRVGGAMALSPARMADAKSKEWFESAGCLYLVDRSAHGHLGIASILLRDCGYGAALHRIGMKVAAIAAAAYLFLVLVGWYLGRLFMEPMRQKVAQLERFVKDSTHELNTPVTTMLLALQKIDAGSFEPSHLRALQMSGRLIARVYEDLTFLLLRPERPEKEAVKTAEVAEAARRSVDFFSVLAERKGIALLCEVKESYSIEADPHHLDMLLKNLVDNALKYTKRGGKVTVVVEKGRLSVVDTGIGIAAEKRQKIFERFHRESDMEGGFGIGLSIVEKVCGLYGWHLKLVSQPGEGSTFQVVMESEVQ